MLDILKLGLLLGTSLLTVHVDGFFKHPDPECLIKQKMTTERKKSQII